MGTTEKETLLKYGWSEFLRTPFSLLFFVLCFTLGYIIYSDKQRSVKSTERYERQISNCNEARLKDKEIYINLLENLKINQELQKNQP